MNTTTAVSSEYPKIETLYDRDPENMKHVIIGALRDPIFGLIDRWLVTEKIDGTNVRVIYEDGTVRIGGKTDNASMPLFLLDALKSRFTAEKLADVWPANDDREPHVVLYGEGYGPKIQKGGNYRSDHGFRLFDVAVQGIDNRGIEKWWWLDWDNVEDVAAKLGIDTVPVLADAATTAEAIEFVRHPSFVALTEGSANIDHEGIVCRTDPLVFNKRGQRVIWKLKGRDLS